MMHESEKVVLAVRSQIQMLQGLLHYLESQGLWSEEDLRYCRATLRRSARDLLMVSRGPLGSVDLVVLTANG